MVSYLHEALLELFRNRPSLAPALIREVLSGELPDFDEARVVAADLTNLQPAEFRADLVIELVDEATVFAVILEVQLSENTRKRFAWPAYVANLRARLKCPVCLLVFTADDVTARWAASPVNLGGLNWFTPYVIGPSGIPELTDEDEACANPELAVLSAMAHGQHDNLEKAVQIAVAARTASISLDGDRRKLYFDLIMKSLPEAARQALETMDLRKYEYQSDFARQYVAQGRAEGRAELLMELLRVRFGDPGAEVETRLRGASVAQLGTIGKQLLSARTLAEALEGL